MCGVPRHVIFLIGPLIFEEDTVTGASHLNMLENYANTRLPQGCIFQQDKDPPHYASPMEAFIN
jgi:hypothetical protein